MDKNDKNAESSGKNSQENWECSNIDAYDPYLRSNGQK